MGMYIAVLVGHLVALLCAFCGVVNLCYLDFDRAIGVQGFFGQLALAFGGQQYQFGLQLLLTMGYRHHQHLQLGLAHLSTTKHFRQLLSTLSPRLFNHLPRPYRDYTDE